jgi:hypothetical protein
MKLTAVFEPATYIQRSNSVPLVIKYARLALEKYNTIEVMDTYHVALMRIIGSIGSLPAEEKLGTGFDQFSVLTL